MSFLQAKLSDFSQFTEFLCQLFSEGLCLSPAPPLVYSAVQSDHQSPSIFPKDAHLFLRRHTYIAEAIMLSPEADSAVRASVEGRDRMNKKSMYALALLSVLLVYCSVLTPSVAADYTKVGVKQGDTAAYSYEATEYPPGMTGTAHILNVTGVLVGLNLTIYNPGGSINSTLETVGNITSGSGFPIPMWFLVAPNLTKDDKIYGLDYVPTFNDTVSMNIAGYSRTANLLNITMDSSNYVRVWLDQATGLFLQLRLRATTTSYNITLTSTSVFGGGISPTTLLLIVGAAAAVIVVAAAALMLRRRRK
jgi:hypothetical protein